MGCGCNKKRGARYQVQLKNGLIITKGSEEEAKAYSDKNPGSKVIKPAA